MTATRCACKSHSDEAGLRSREHVSPWVGVRVQIGTGMADLAHSETKGEGLRLGDVPEEEGGSSQ